MRPPAPSLPSAQASGWRMQRAEYERLVQLVRPDAERVAQLAERHGLFPSAKEWMASWEAIWEATLAGCDGATGECDVGTKAG